MTDYRVVRFEKFRSSTSGVCQKALDGSVGVTLDVGGIDTVATQIFGCDLILRLQREDALHLAQKLIEACK